MADRLGYGILGEPKRREPRSWGFASSDGGQGLCLARWPAAGGSRAAMSLIESARRIGHAMQRLVWLLSAGVLLSGSLVRAQDWVSQTFPERSHDFGTVARGSKVHHTFRVVNT